MSNQPGTSTVASTIATQQKPQELKLGQPPTFDGNPNKARGWFNNTQLYLLVNKDIYNDDDQKIAFMLSFMREGSTALWALTETEAAFKRNPPSFGTWQDFLNKFSTSFILENTKDQAITWMTTTKVDKRMPLMEYICPNKLLLKRNPPLSNEENLWNGHRTNHDRQMVPTDPMLPTHMGKDKRNCKRKTTSLPTRTTQQQIQEARPKRDGHRCRPTI